MITADKASLVKTLHTLLAVRDQLHDLAPAICLDADERGVVYSIADVVDHFFNKLLEKA